MRAIAFALLFCLPLAAEEQSLKKAVELLRDDDAPARERGALMADREVRRLLAPLLKAFEDKDPEVRRRARRTILGLIPGEAEKDEQDEKVRIEAQLKAALNAALAAMPQRRQGKFLQINHAMQLHLKRKAKLTDAGNRFLARFGISGRTQRQAPFTPGFLVVSLQKGSPAEQLGLKTGDLIIRINGKPVSEIVHFAPVLEKPAAWDRMKIDIHREKKVLRLPLKPPPPAGR